jgi:biotin synthase-related radical SAM superfamily protein
MMHRRGRCAANCGFCAQARTSRTPQSYLSRVTWPVFPLAQVLASLSEQGQGSPFKRVCIQTLHYPKLMNDLLAVVEALRRAVPSLPVSVALPPLSRPEIVRIEGAGVERAAISLDAATPGLFSVLKGSGVNSTFRWETHVQALRDAVAVFGAGKTTTHLILGLGETEKEAVSCIQWLTDLGITVGLFPFTPISGTHLAARPPPPVEQYRRLQLAHYLIAHQQARAEQMTFHPVGQHIVGFGLSKELLAAVIDEGLAFQTAGCRGCNRPFFTERPSGPLYNFPTVPSAGDIRQINEQLGVVR